MEELIKEVNEQVQVTGNAIEDNLVFGVHTESQISELTLKNQWVIMKTLRVILENTY